MKILFSRPLILTLWISAFFLLAAAMVPPHDLVPKDMENTSSVDVYHVANLGNKARLSVSADSELAKFHSDLQPGQQANPEHYDVPVCVCGLSEPVECYCYWL